MVILLGILALIFLWCLHLYITREDITRDDTGELYLRRFFIWKGGPGKPRLLLHKFYRGDEDPHMHDHPWGFTSFILTRGYFEETPISEWSHLSIKQLVDAEVQLDADGNAIRHTAWYPRFSVLRRPAQWKHRVILKDKKPVWTLVWTGSKVRDWGFWIKDRMCPWKSYKNGVCWCGPNGEIPWAGVDNSDLRELQQKAIEAVGN